MQQGPPVAEGEHRLPQQHDVEGASWEVRDLTDLVAAAQVPNHATRGLHGRGAGIDTDELAPEPPSDQASGASRATTQVEHGGVGGDPRPHRQRVDISGTHEPVLVNELGRPVRSAPGAPVRAREIPESTINLLVPEGHPFGGHGETARKARAAARWRHNHQMSRPKDSTTRSTATTSRPAMTGDGRTPAEATTRIVLAAAVVTLRQYRGGSWARSQGRTHPAAAKTYRARPIVSTHQPTAGATHALRTSMRKASISPSNRAPKAEAVSVARATWPSTRSRNRETPATAMIVIVQGEDSMSSPARSDVATRAVTAQLSVARVRVTMSAGPREAVRSC